MAITKTSVQIIAPTSVPAGTTKALPVAGAALDCRSYAGGDIVYSITNGASAPTIPGAIMFQASDDGTTWYDYQTVGGDSVASSVSSGTIWLDPGIMYLRAIGYQNTVNAVTIAAKLMAIAG